MEMPKILPLDLDYTQPSGHLCLQSAKVALALQAREARLRPGYFRVEAGSQP